MTYWHMQLHPNNSVKFDEDKVWEILWNTNTIGMGESWENDKGAPDIFKKEMKIGDLVLIRPMYALVKVVSDWYTLNSSEVNEELDWFPLRRNVQFLSSNYPENYETLRDNIFNPTTLSIIKESNTEAHQYIKNWYNNL